LEPRPGEHRGESGEEDEAGARSRRRARAYQWATEAAFSIPIAIAIGYWADSKLGTSPWLLLAGVLVGLGAALRRLLRLRRLVEEEAREATEARPPEAP
jgi:F0F1-type ATP synthase assembly protein I